MRRSTRAHAKKPDPHASLEETVPANGAGTPRQGRRGRPADGVPNGGADMGSAPWSGSSSPLSSLSTPASMVAQPKGRTRQRVRTRPPAARQGADSGDDDDDGDDGASANGDRDSDDPAVTNLLSRAAAAIRNEISNSQLSTDEDNGDDGQSEGGAARPMRSRAPASGRRRRRTESQDESPADTPAPKRRSARMSAHGNGNGAADSAATDAGSAASPGSSAQSSGVATANGWDSRKRGRNSRLEPDQRRLTGAAGHEGDHSAVGASPAAPSTPTAPARQTPRTPAGSHRARPPAGATNGHADDESSDDEEPDKDPAGEEKIDRNGYLQGGREFICPLFRSPFRRNKERQYVLTMDCCRYMGARDSYMLFKQHPRMRRVETTQQERDLLADRLMIPKVTRFRPIALITARTAFREFGARIVKDGRYIVDDYWEDIRRREARHPEGALIANMSVYHSVMAAHAAGVTPGSTRKARKTTPLRPPTGSSAKSFNVNSSTPTRGMSGFGVSTPTALGGMMVSSWAQLEAQQRVQQQMGTIGLLPSLSSATQLRAGGLTMANALQQQQQQQPQQQSHQSQQPSQQHLQQQQPSQLQLLQHVGAIDGDSEEVAGIPLSRPVFRKMRAAETAEAAFEAGAAAHRAHFADDHGYVDGRPLIHSLATAWPRVTSLTNKLKQKRGTAGLVQRTASEDGSQTPQKDSGEDLFGPMAFASSRMARDFNASVRLWREDNGCTWVDPHTGIRQVPASLQPTTVRVERIDVGDARWRRAGKTKIEPLVSFADNVDDSGDEGVGGSDGSGAREYPLALLPGQFQATFPAHRTRYGQSYQQTMQSYSYHWMRQLVALQQQQQRKLLAQQQQQQQQHAGKKRT
ncbi:chromatin structure-remodeling complex subunit RSC7 [Coemansia biformis]|uniref:Chromatin structure-remodeling complex subunit RSC7 n=1 Tax=Coemansia biformis TaxID=1286918 RepID=A0A9W7YBJ2_9FUNG|nr:chromatin structure-remodeling complex subunit RSC7 [Coemansia biformis]